MFFTETVAKDTHVIMMWVLPIARPDSFLLGMLIAVSIERFRLDTYVTAVRGRFLLLAALGGLALVAQYPGISSGSWHRIWQYPAVSISFGAILLVCLSNQSSLLINGLGSRLLTFLGRISYGLYVYHMLAIAIVTRVFSKLLNAEPSSNAIWLTEGLCALLATIAVSAISYQWLERPFLKRKERYALIGSRLP